MINKKNKALLYIAYHYPPITVSSGVHRTLAFTRHLSENNWHVEVLSTTLHAYLNWDVKQLDLIPKKVRVRRALALDVARHLSFKGKYLDWMALPDRWQSWIPFAVISGLFTIKQNRCNVIVSTYPIASAHIIAYVLHRLTGVPWVADLRDPMAQVDYPSNPRLRNLFLWIEQKMVKHCEKVLITTPGAKSLYTTRYPNTPSDFWQILPNGYDEHLLDPYIDEEIAKPISSRLKFLHSGTMYPVERDPRSLYQALAELKSEETDLSLKLEICLRATGSDAYHAKLLTDYGINDIVSIQPSLAYKDAILDMLSADALLLMQSSGCNHQIPAKAYEYIRVKRPILALTDPEGDSAELMRKSNVAIIAPLDDVTRIKLAIRELIARCNSNGFEFLDDDKIKQFSRKHQAIQLEQMLSEII